MDSDITRQFKHAKVPSVVFVGGNVGTRQVRIFSGIDFNLMQNTDSGYRQRCLMHWLDKNCDGEYKIGWDCLENFIVDFPLQSDADKAAILIKTGIPNVGGNLEGPELSRSASSLTFKGNASHKVVRDLAEVLKVQREGAFNIESYDSDLYNKAIVVDSVSGEVVATAIVSGYECDAILAERDRILNAIERKEYIPQVVSAKGISLKLV